MPYVEPEIIEQVRQIDLLTYLRKFEPDNVEAVSYTHLDVYKRQDMEYMCSLTGKTEQEIYGELKGVIFLNPMYGYGNSTELKYLMADEYQMCIRDRAEPAKHFENPRYIRFRYDGYHRASGADRKKQALFLFGRC